MDWITLHWQSVVDWLIRTVLTGGVGYNAWRYWRERKLRKAKGHIEESKASVEEQTIDDKVTSSSITTLQAGHVAVVAAAESERIALRGTIVFLEDQVSRARQREVELENQIIEKNNRIHSLQEQVEQLQSQIRSQAEQLMSIADELKALQVPPADTA